MWTEWSRALGSLNLCAGQLQDVCAQWFHLSPLAPLWRECFLPLLCSLSTTACCGICVRLFIWVMSPTCPLGSQVSGLRKAVSESHRDYWAFCGSPWFWGWWEVRTFPMEAINFHIWVAIHLNQIISEQKDVLWWALNLSLLPTADLLPDIQHNCSFWPFCPHGTYPSSTLASPALPLPPRGKWAAILAAPQ